MHVFYQPDIQEKRYLDEEESRHAVKVLRLGLGDSIRIIDGKGGLFDAEIIDPDPRKCAIFIRSSNLDTTEKKYGIHLVITPTKDLDRIEWMLEKCVEIGVDEVTFILTRRTDERYWKGKSIHPDRLEKIAVSAVKQSLKRYVPRVNGLMMWESFLQKDFTDSQLFIAHLEPTERRLLQIAAQPGATYVMLIGPEGDFTSQEIEQAKEKGFSPVSLGESRLRTETAGLVSVLTLQLMNQV
ncbi:MAG: RsmE family RNA methyltransferase [Siphonobacter sp.]